MIAAAAFHCFGCGDEGVFQTGRVRGGKKVEVAHGALCYHCVPNISPCANSTKCRCVDGESVLGLTFPLSVRSRPPTRSILKRSVSWIIWASTEGFVISYNTGCRAFERAH